MSVLSLPREPRLGLSRCQLSGPRKRSFWAGNQGGLTRPSGRTEALGADYLARARRTERGFKGAQRPVAQRASSLRLRPALGLP